MSWTKRLSNVLSDSRQVLCPLKLHSSDLLPKSPLTATDGDGINQYSLDTD